MRLEIDYTRSAQKNAEEYYNRAKKLQAKSAGARQAATELQKRASRQERESDRARMEGRRKEVKVRKAEWYEKFHWFFTSESLLALGGRDAKQNELLNSNYFEDGDLFLHADIFGAAVTILKEGKGAGEASVGEAAQFAGCYSSAWKEALGTVDVYAVQRGQVSKSTSSGSLGTGSFLIKGERKWYRGIALSLVMFVRGGVLNTVPLSAFERIDSSTIGPRAVITVGRDKKSDAAKKIATALGHDDLDEIIRQLPAGSFSVRTQASR